MTKLIEKTEFKQVKMRPIPKSWQQAAGLASNKKKALIEHGEKIRNEWSKK